MGHTQDLQARQRFVDATEEETILNLRREGHTMAEIARRTGWSAMTIQRRIERYIKGENAKHAPELRAIEASRLEMLWEKALESVQATTLVTDSRGNPVKVPVIGPDGEPVRNEQGEIVMEYQIDRAPVLAGVAACIRVMERKARLLGLDLPQRVAIEDSRVQAGPTEITFNVIEAQSGRHLTDEERAAVLERTADAKPVGLFDEEP